MTRIWLTRHAETAAPAIFHGAESDIDLSDLGRRQAGAAAAWFAMLPDPPTAVVSSGMRRAVETATPIAAACGVPHVIEPELHERRVGALSGTAFSATDGGWAETVRRWSSGETGFTTPGAEAFDRIAARVVPPLVRVADRFAGGRVVVVAHGVVCKVLLLSVLRGYGPSAWVTLGRVPNLAVSELVRDAGGWTAAELLVVPPPVAALTAGEPTGVGAVRVRSEA
jgi:probable phosphoglycerate mutase